MWSALTSDLQEFVSTVTEDTSNVLSQIDSGLATDEEDVNDTSLDVEDNAGEEGEETP